MSTPPSSPSSERDSGPIPALLVGLGILAVGAIVVFWPGGDGPEPRPVGDHDGAAGRRSAEGRKGGIPERAVDEAAHGAKADAPRPRVSKAVRNMPHGIQENVPDRGPPESFESPEAERKWYEAALERAREELAFRQKAVERLKKARDEIDKASDPAAARATFERRREIVEQNLQRAQERVAELERKLESLGSAP